MSPTPQTILVHIEQLPHPIWLNSEVFKCHYAPFFLTLRALFLFINCLRNNWTLLNFRNLPKSFGYQFGIWGLGPSCFGTITGLRSVQVLHKPLFWFLACLRNTWTLLNTWTPWALSLYAKQVSYQFWLDSEEFKGPYCLLLFFFFSPFSFPVVKIPG